MDKRYYKFELADCVRSKVELNKFNGNFNGFDSFSGGSPSTLVNTPFKFKIDESELPKFCKDKQYVELRAAEDVTVTSIWKGFLGYANTGINNLANSINKLFNSGYKDQGQLDPNEPFMPTIIHTGLRCSLPNDVVMHININSDNGLLIAGGTRIYTGDGEILVPLYNIYPSDIRLLKGQVVAVATLHKLEIPENDLENHSTGCETFEDGLKNKPKINLNKNGVDRHGSKC